MKPELIETSAHMDELLTRLRNEKLIAVDTEFFRETTYYPQIALIQIATDSIVACIDPLAFDAKPALQKILLDPGITKIFHSCSQDLEVLYYYLDAVPTTIYDTQIAHAFISEHHQIGYASLVENELGVALDKSQTRTNWLQRPLTEKQIQYAGDDVLYLFQLQHKLDKKLHDLGRKSWFEEDSFTLNNNENNFQVKMDILWKRVKGASRLNRNKLVIVQHIALWREALAQLKDKTRRRMLADDIVINLAINAPEDITGLDQCIGKRYSFNHEEKQQLLKSIKTAMLSAAESWPDNRLNILNNQQKKLLKDLQQIINNKANELGISSAILSSKKDLEKLISHSEKNHESRFPEMGITQGWRFRCVGQQLVEIIKNAK